MYLKILMDKILSQYKNVQKCSKMFKNFIKLSKNVDYSWAVGN